MNTDFFTLAIITAVYLVYSIANCKLSPLNSHIDTKFSCAVRSLCFSTFIIHARVFKEDTYFRCVFQDLSESLDSRESDLLGELKTSAQNLKLVCNEEVQNEIDYQVDESVQAFNDSRKSLSSLCARYENAVKIWANYRRNSDIVSEWVDDQLHSLSNLPPEEAINQIQVRFPNKINSIL